MAGKEQAMGPDHTTRLRIVTDLGNVYEDQGKLNDAEDIYQ